MQRLKLAKQVLKSIRSLNCLTDLGARLGHTVFLKGQLKTDDESRGAGKYSPLRPNHWKRQKILVIALQARPQACPHERRLARTGCAEDDQHPFDPLLADTSQRIEAAHDRGVPTEEHGCVLGLQRSQARIRRPLDIVRRRPGKARGIEPGASQPKLEPGKPRFGERDFRLRDERVMPDPEALALSPRDEVTELRFRRPRRARQRSSCPIVWQAETRSGTRESHATRAK